jgi:hypothetical protein
MILRQNGKGCLIAGVMEVLGALLAVAIHGGSLLQCSQESEYTAMCMYRQGRKCGVQHGEDNSQQKGTLTEPILNTANQ